ncbi:MAG TPA: type IV pilus assembly protein PilM [Gaiellaceae bacterium]|nr:type IV pilus assembly protein PilM [Gaiellaceae bacterium]
MPDWNKEVSFRRRKPAAPAPAPAEAKTPFWKQELSLGRRPKQPQAVPGPKPAATPFWKQELSLGRRPKQAQAVPEPKPAATPFWKKELSLGRKPKQPQATKPPADVPFWKREIGGKKKEKPAVATAAEAPAVAPAAAPPPPAEPAEDYSWLTDRLDVYAPEPGAASSPPAAAEPEPVAGAWPPPSPEPVVAVAWPPPSTGPVPASAPETAPADVPAPAPVVQPAAPAPAKTPFWKKELGRRKPLPIAPASRPAAPAKLPFWKRDLSLGGAKAPKEPKPPKPPKAKGEPFWKKELSLGRGPKAPKQPKAPKAKGEPFWKRELSLGGAKGSKQPKAAKVKGEPFWKRDFSLGGGKAPKQAAPGAPPQKQENVTFVGLKIGASQLAAARIHNNGAPTLLQVARDPLDDGLVVGGELRDVEGLSEALKAFFARHKLPKKGVRLGIANNRIGVRSFDIEGIQDPKQLANAIRFRAQETLPIPLEEAVLDWQVLHEETGADGAPTRRVLLVVAYRELVDRYVLACRKAGIRLAGIDLEAFAVLRALAAPAAEGDQPVGAQVVVNVGHDRSTFAVTDGRVCEFTRVLAWGGQNLNVAIARALDMTPSEAAPIKHALSLVDSSVALEGVTAETVQVVCSAVRGELQSFARELVSSLHFYQNQPESLGIAELLLTGGTAELPGLAGELERLTGVGVRVGDPFQRLKLGKKVADPEHTGSLAVAIGLGIED